MRTIGLLLSIMALALGAEVSSAATGREQAFTVRSTLTGKTVLPHRIRWLGIPSLPPAKVAEVDFLIDGKLRWVEHHAPYTYGFDGNYLVTSWLIPGSHTFAVRAISTAHQRASTSTTARVLPASPPPAALAGTWKRTLTKAEAGNSGPSGLWQLTINKIGWQFRAPGGRGALVDVAYLSSGTLEARGGIATKNRSPQEGNPWCEEPFQPVRYRWSITGSSLKLTLAGPKRCDGQSDIWAGDWTRAS
jgi:hypothetical protein